MTKVPDSVVHADYDPEVSWTIDQYHAVIEAGVFTTEDSIELLDGKLTRKRPKGHLHEVCRRIINRYLIPRFFETHDLSQETPIVLRPASEAEPDYVILDLKADNYASGKPQASNVHLIIEIADSSLEKDRSTKVAIYASAGLTEYWIVNLRHRQLELYTKPRSEQSVYSRTAFYAEDESFPSPFCGMVRVADLLPPPESPSGSESSQKTD